MSAVVIGLIVLVVAAIGVYIWISYEPTSADPDGGVESTRLQLRAGVRNAAARIAQKLQ